MVIVVEYDNLKNNNFDNDNFDNSVQFYIEKSGIIKDRMIIFLDHANLFHPIIPYNIRIDYIKFKEIIAQNYHLVVPIAYLGIPRKKYTKQYRKKFRFVRYLQSAGFHTEIVKLQVRPNGTMRQRLIDMQIHKDMINLAEQDAYDIAALLSGDSDLVDTVRRVIKMGKKVFVYSWEQALSKKYKQVVGKNNIFYIDDMCDDIVKLSN